MPTSLLNPHPNPDSIPIPILHGLRERKQKRAGRATRSRGEKGGVRAGVRLEWCKLGSEGHERQGSPPTLHSLTLLASLGGLFLWGTLPA